MSAHGVTLTMRYIKRPPPTFIHQHAPAIKTQHGYAKPPGLRSYVNPEKDRSLAGKARRRARKAATR